MNIRCKYCKKETIVVGEEASLYAFKYRTIYVYQCPLCKQTYFSMRAPDPPKEKEWRIS